MTVLCREIAVAFPPIETDRLGLVDRADDQPDADRQELDFGERDFDVSRDDEPLVQDAVENIDQTARTVETQVRFRQCLVNP